MANPRPTNRTLGLTAAACAVFVAGMVGVTFASAPLYRVFCQVTGYAGTTQKAERAPGSTVDRTVTVRFDANVGNGLGWSFRPLTREVTVRLGEVGTAVFVAENRMPAPASGSAAFNVAPGEAGLYFNKIACFCFTEQTLAPGERVEMPVTFFVDPALAADSELGGLNTITLSYTFYPAVAPLRPVAAAAGVKASDAL
jgi:cytochrome c oxidase assembly protein subunit 11